MYEKELQSLPIFGLPFNYMNLEATVLRCNQNRSQLESAVGKLLCIWVGFVVLVSDISKLVIGCIYTNIH